MLFNRIGKSRLATDMSSISISLADLKLTSIDQFRAHFGYLAVSHEKRKTYTTLTFQPEFQEDEESAHASESGDVWSLGIIALHVLTGRYPFEVGE